jgi:hypothetical protein
MILFMPSGLILRFALTENAVRSIAARWSWPEQLKLWDSLKKELRLETVVEAQYEADRSGACPIFKPATSNQRADESAEFRGSQIVMIPLIPSETRFYIVQLKLESGSDAPRLMSARLFRSGAASGSHTDPPGLRDVRPAERVGSFNVALSLSKFRFSL